MTNNRVTIKDIAKAVGVSPATVSMALNEKGSLPLSRRMEIKRQAEEMGYVASSIAQALRGKRTNLVGVICSDFSNPMFRDFFAGLEESLRPFNYDVLTTQSFYHPERETKLIQKMLQQSVEALIIEPCAPPNPLLEEVAKRLPIVQIIQVMVPGLPAVCSDNERGAELVTRHLVGLAGLDGRPVVHVAGDERFSAFRERKRGFCRTLAKLCPDIDPERQIISLRGLHYEEGLLIAPTIFQTFKPPLALFVVNDMVALGIVNHCRKVGLRIPEDVAIAGFCNVEQLEMYGSPLTSVEFSKRGMGRVAGDMVMAHLDADKPLVSSTVELPVSLVVRGSTGMPGTLGLLPLNMHSARTTPCWQRGAAPTVKP